MIGQITTLLLDIDGVVNHRGNLIPNIDELLWAVINQGITVKFVTNCSLHKLHGFGNKIVPGVQFEVFDPLDVLARLIFKDSTIHPVHLAVIGTREIRQRVAEFGINILANDDPEVNAVFIFEKLHYDQDEILQASRSVLNGARLYSAGPDRLFWYQGGVYPGVGAITAQIKYMTQVDPVVLGKPSKHLFDLALLEREDLGKVLYVGDDAEIDMLGAKQYGLMTAFITRDTFVNEMADVIARDFSDFVNKLL